ncbi:MAG: alcohol dehydrogenase catalytic domain-containing protein, partial [Pacificimonas sp.]
MRTTRAVIREHGGPGVIAFEDATLPHPGRDEVQVRINAIGLNMIDTYHRSGIYPVALPSGLGIEFAGRIEIIGENVAGFKIGDRVAAFAPPLGAYATARNVPASILVPIPDDLGDEEAAAVLLKGCTAEFLIERCGRIEAGMDVLIHAAAGAMGLLLTQWLTAIGARVIGTTSSDEKAEKAKAMG